MRTPTFFRGRWQRAKGEIIFIKICRCDTRPSYSRVALGEAGVEKPRRQTPHSADGRRDNDRFLCY